MAVCKLDVNELMICTTAHQDSMISHILPPEPDHNQNGGKFKELKVPANIWTFPFLRPLEPDTSENDLNSASVTERVY